MTKVKIESHEEALAVAIRLIEDMKQWTLLNGEESICKYELLHALEDLAGTLEQ